MQLRKEPGFVTPTQIQPLSTRLWTARAGKQTPRPPPLSSPVSGAKHSCGVLDSDIKGVKQKHWWVLTLRWQSSGCWKADHTWLQSLKLQHRFRRAADSKFHFTYLSVYSRPFIIQQTKEKKKKAGTCSRFSAVTLQNMWNKKIWALWTHPFTWSQVKSPDHFTLKVFTAKKTKPKTNTRWGRAICEKKSDFWSETEQQLRLAGIKCPDIHKPQCPHFGEIIKVKPSLISALLCLWL